MHPLAGIALNILSLFVFSLMTVLIKMVSNVYPPGQLVFMRSLFAIVPIMALLLAKGELFTGLRTTHPRRHLARASVGIIGMFCNFTALAMLPLPDATAISFAVPLFSVILAVIFLKEKVRLHRWVAIGIGLFGVLVILVPHIDASIMLQSNKGELLGAAFALIGAFMGASAAVTIRNLTSTETTMAIAFYFALACTVIGALTAPFGWVRPTPLDAGIMISMGLIGGVAQIIITQSYRLALASVLAPFYYTSLIWAILFGWLFFNEIPNAWMLGGAAIVIASGLYVVLREHHHTRILMQEEKASKLAAKPEI